MLQAQAAFSEVLGRLLQHRRKEKGFTQADFAAALSATLHLTEKIGHSAWSRIESGQTTITVTQLRAAAEVLGTPAWQLLQEAEGLITKLSKASPSVAVVPERPKSTDAASAAGWFIGGAALGALLGALLADNSKSSR